MGIDKELHIGERVHIILVIRKVAGLEIHQHHTAAPGAEHHIYIPFAHPYRRIVQKGCTADEHLEPDGGAVTVFHCVFHAA